MEINVEQTNNFNRLITNLLDNLLESNDFTLNIFLNSFYEDNMYENILRDSFDNDLQLNKNDNINLSIDKEKYLLDTKCECCICINNIKKNQDIYHCKNCNKTFHYNCMNEWVKSSSTCPICRTNIDVVNTKNFENWIDDNLNI